MPTTPRSGRSNAVSAVSLSKTGIFAVAAGDFRRIGLDFRGSGGPETPAGGPFRSNGDPLYDAETGWLGREDSNLEMAI